MTRKATEAEGLLIIRKARMVTEIVLSLADNQADYVTLLVTVLGNGVSAFCEEENDAEFEHRLATVHKILDSITRNARERMFEANIAEAESETKH